MCRCFVGRWRDSAAAARMAPVALRGGRQDGARGAGGGPATRPPCLLGRGKVLPSRGAPCFTQDT